MATEPGAGAFTRCAYGSGGDDGAYGSGGDDGAYGSGGGQDVPSAISTSKSRIGGARTMALQGIEPEECDPSCQDRFLRVENSSSERFILTGELSCGLDGDVGAVQEACWVCLFQGSEPGQDLWKKFTTRTRRESLTGILRRQSDGRARHPLSQLDDSLAS
ncbi:uncharacterized protein [Triticum aestivum]|uniref:uncharacterized protein isoform X3 n=1 Tax=Triticum aestivum TaxID=4565 RepID=UPI001D004154|nr:uncharacterized protein LOC123156998 isoform X3 [Triticum aestivum]XP_044431152.1 uncharacterized protein LOC123156998 isoform X3 [Triticum aestivum]XP_044431153.1 uncharacterized protein LOC123156998 isoform X3 [Triticum aestivum]XP_044431154.1 uncharacterized protein LOC123156998 isoform X3 [Triticum aestivum]XP_044431155.1 uncharacterized protein LOC123156998 isoform X3 [Triticum aestivum]XP_044431156.1 uncharacterized protein LOC123156998 isoform X3 [Triticum aestivum]